MLTLSRQEEQACRAETHAQAAEEVWMTGQLTPAANDDGMEKIFEERRIAVEAEIEHLRAEPNKYCDG